MLCRADCFCKAQGQKPKAEAVQIRATSVQDGAANTCRVSQQTHLGCTGPGTEQPYDGTTSWASPSPEAQASRWMGGKSFPHGDSQTSGRSIGLCSPPASIPSKGPGQCSIQPSGLSPMAAGVKLCRERAVMPELLVPQWTGHWPARVPGYIWPVAPNLTALKGKWGLAVIQLQWGLGISATGESGGINGHCSSTLQPRAIHTLHNPFPCTDPYGVRDARADTSNRPVQQPQTD